jgi:hypothetical protein
MVNTKKAAEDGFEPYVKTATIMELFDVKYGFINKYTKPDKQHPDRPVMPHLPIGSQKRFRMPRVLRRRG